MTDSVRGQLLAKFISRSFTVERFADLSKRRQLQLAPKWQRRQVWDYKIKSYFIDSLLRGFSIPKIYLRPRLRERTRTNVHEVVDGQQRLRAIISFLEGELKVSQRDNEKYGDTEFAALPEKVRRDFLDYEIAVDLMTDASDEEVLETFARLNTYTVRLNRQELRNARFYGEFKRTSYRIATEHLAFFQTNGILSAKQIIRMADAELVSELIVAMLSGLQDKKKSVDKFYREYNDKFEKAEQCEKRFAKVLDDITDVLGEELGKTRFRRKTLFYSVFLVFFDIRYGLPPRRGPIGVIKADDYGRCRKVLHSLSSQIEAEVPSPQYQEFFNACKQQTDNLQPRQIRHNTILGVLSPYIAPAREPS